MLNDIDILRITYLTIAAVQPPDPPMFTQTAYQASVNETFDPTHPRPSDGFVTIACIDPVSGDPAVGIAYSIPATSGIIPFAVDSTSGALSVTEDLDFETDPNTYSFPVLCNYTEFSNSSAMSTVEITVLPVNEFRPTVVGMSIFTENINEDAITGTIIAATSGAGLISYEVTDNDAGLDDSTITFTFTTENSITNLFSLNLTTGYLVLGQELDLDSGAISPFLTLEITACDLIPAVDDCPNIQVRLLVNAVNEFSPEFSQDSYSASIQESALENSEVVVVQCADEDVGVGAFEGINIASTDQTILDIFSVDSTTGNITLSRPVDFETDPQSFVFMVECNDTDGLQSLATVSVTIEGVNDFTPVFSQPTYAIDILESSPAGVVLEVAQCIDDDTGVGAFAGIQIVSTDQETLDTFGVDGSSGNITLERELDFENIDRYEFMVRCFDNEGLETLSVVTVSVGDVFEAIQFSQVVYEASVNETFLPTNPRPLDGFITVMCVNPNTSTPLTNSTYNITTNTPLPFNINSETGELVVTEDLDFESGTTSYSFSVMCSLDIEDGSNVTTVTDTAVVEITILAVNEFSPEFSQPTYDASITESTNISTTIVEATCTDDDVGVGAFERIEIASTDQNVLDTFAVDGTSGNIYLQQPLNFESIQMYAFTIRCFDNVGTEINSNVTVNVLAVNEFPPQFSQDLYEASILESTSTDSEVLVANCTDADDGTGALESINIVSSDSATLNIFAIDSATGNVTLRRQVNFEVDPQIFTFMVQCNDTEGLQTSAMVNISIEGVNEFPPEFSQPAYEINTPESTAVGTELEVARCTDDDVGVGAFDRIEIVSSDQNILDTFTIDNSSGSINLERELNFESIQMYAFTIRCFDNVGTEINSNVTVNVLAVNEFPPQFSQDLYEASILESTPTDSEVLVANCTDADVGTGALESINIVSSDSATLNIFAIDSATGNVTLRRQVNFEVDPQMFTFMVQCNDTEGLQTSAMVNISIEGVNEFPPEFSQPAYEINTPESTAVGTELEVARCTDDDVGVGAFDRIEIVSSNQNILDTFTIDNSSGSITLERELNFESIQMYAFTIRCFDNVGTEINSNVTVNVLAVNEFPPQFSQDLYEASILESTPTDSEVLVANCTDADVGTGALESINIISSDSATLNIFTIDSTTGSMTLRRQVNFEVDPRIFTFMVQCNDTEGLQTSAMVNISIEGVNEFPPEFSQPTYEIDTPESTAVGTELEVARCTDDDVGVGAFAGIEIVSSDQNILDTFSIDSSSGSITLERELDFESIDGYSFMLRCFDNEGMEVFTSVNVTVGNINDVLQFTEPIYEASVNETFIPEYPRPMDGFITVVCVDPDPTIPVVDVVYSITANLSLPFSINNETGALSATEDLDFDAGNTSYSFDVVCVLNALPDVSDRATVEITILPVNEFRPEIIGSSVIPQPVLETLMVGTVIASTTNSSLIEYTFEDADAGVADRNVTFTFAEEAGDTSFFSLDLVTGNLTLVRELDFDNQTEDVYFVQIPITLCDIFPPVDTCPNLDIRLIVAAVNEFDPQFPQDIYEASIPESIEVNSEVVVVECIDLDRGTGALASIDIISTDQNVTDTFNIDSSTGNITLRQEVDFETIRSYEFTVQCRDAGFNDTAVVRITIEDVNDNNPEPQPIDDIMLNDQTPIGTVVTTAVCTDRDTVDSTITYTLNNSLGLFEIATSSGEINTTGALILDSTTFIQDYELTVLCTDSGIAPRTGTTLINIQVYKNDATPPSFSTPTLTANVLENATVGEEVITVQANDIDSPELQFSLANENIPGLFAINSSTGAITISQTLDRESANAYQATIVATEVRVAPGIPQSGTTQLTINIQDVNDSPPTCDNTASQLTATITAGSHDSTSLSVTFSCNDADDGDNRVLRYSLIESTLPALDRGNFVINEATGQLTLEGAIRAGTYSFSVRVSDSGQPPQSLILEVSLTVSPADDETPVHVIVIPIVVIVFGLLFIIILVIVVVALLRRRRKHKGARIR